MSSCVVEIKIHVLFRFLFSAVTLHYWLDDRKRRAFWPVKDLVSAISKGFLESFRGT